MGISYISESQLHPALRKKIQYLQGAVAVSIVLDLVLVMMLMFLLFPGGTGSSCAERDGDETRRCRSRGMGSLWTGDQGVAVASVVLDLVLLVLLVLLFLQRR